MTMRISKSIESVKKERAIIKEMSDYFTDNIFDSHSPEMVKKLEDYLYNLFEINMKDMGYEPRLIPKGQESNFDIILNDEQQRIVNLAFWKLYELVEGNSWGGVKYEDHSNMIYPQLRININSGYYDKIEKPADIYRLIETLYHEMNHIKQYVMLKKQESSFENLINGCAFLIFKRRYIWKKL